MFTERIITQQNYKLELHITKALKFLGLEKNTLKISVTIKRKYTILFFLVLHHY